MLENLLAEGDTNCILTFQFIKLVLARISLNLLPSYSILDISKLTVEI